VSLITTPAVLLRSYPYGETSRILRFLTEDLGVVGTMARGVRREDSKRGSSLDTFGDGILAMHFKENRDLQTYRGFSVRRARPALGTHLLRLGGAALLAEIILVHTLEEGNPELYRRFLLALDEVAEGEDQLLRARILAGAWSVVGALGFGPSIGRCVACGRGLGAEEIGRFDCEAGGVRCAGCGREELPRVGPVARSHLFALVAGSAPEELRGARAHLQLLAGFIHSHLAPARTLRSLPLVQAQFGAEDV